MRAGETDQDEGRRHERGPDYRAHRRGRGQQSADASDFVTLEPDGGTGGRQRQATDRLRYQGPITHGPYSVLVGHGLERQTKQIGRPPQREQREASCQRFRDEQE